VHWGSNWGYNVLPDQIRFAHDLIDGGVDVVHGHSSHHSCPIEMYRDKLILYGCDDLINDYEGITGYDQYWGDLSLLYFASVEPDTGGLFTSSKEVESDDRFEHALVFFYRCSVPAAFLAEHSPCL
jgi:poly-gamma-glutamate capsule biosynthesis protein CapA/YwtB (metallophosphatase superfamily)